MIKNTTKAKSYFSILLILLLVSACATKTTSLREHPTLESQLLDIDSVLIVTPSVSIEQINFSADNERLTELESSIQKELISLARNKLSARGFEIIDFDFEKAITEDENLAYAVTQTKDGFKEAQKKLYEEPLTEKDIRKFQVSVGTAVNLLAEKSGADAVLLIHYSGFKKSSANVTKDVVVGVLSGLLLGVVPVSNSQSSYVECAFIDGVTGDVLWTNISAFTSLDLSAANDALASFPEDIDTLNNVSTKYKESESVSEKNVE
jgi:hypothetical protein